MTLQTNDKTNLNVLTEGQKGLFLLVPHSGAPALIPLRLFSESKLTS